MCELRQGNLRPRRVLTARKSVQDTRVTRERTRTTPGVVRKSVRSRRALALRQAVSIARARAAAIEAAQALQLPPYTPLRTCANPTPPEVPVHWYQGAWRDVVSTPVNESCVKGRDTPHFRSARSFLSPLSSGKFETVSPTPLRGRKRIKPFSPPLSKARAKARRKRAKTRSPSRPRNSKTNVTARMDCGDRPKGDDPLRVQRVESNSLPPLGRGKTSTRCNRAQPNIVTRLERAQMNSTSYMNQAKASSRQERTEKNTTLHPDRIASLPCPRRTKVCSRQSPASTETSSPPQAECSENRLPLGPSSASTSSLHNKETAPEQSMQGAEHASINSPASNAHAAVLQMPRLDNSQHKELGP